MQAVPPKPMAVLPIKNRATKRDAKSVEKEVGRRAVGVVVGVAVCVLVCVLERFLMLLDDGVFMVVGLFPREN